MDILIDECVNLIVYKHLSIILMWTYNYYALIIKTILTRPCLLSMNRHPPSRRSASMANPRRLTPLESSRPLEKLAHRPPMPHCSLAAQVTMWSQLELVMQQSNRHLAVPTAIMADLSDPEMQHY